LATLPLARALQTCTTPTGPPARPMGGRAARERALRHSVRRVRGLMLFDNTFCQQGRKALRVRGACATRKHALLALLTEAMA